MSEKDNIIVRFVDTLTRMIDGPITIFREKIVEPNQQKYPWYHRKFRRVPTVNDCYVDDFVCYTEANLQYHRDRLVDTNILGVLKQRHQECFLWNMEDPHLCDHLWDVVEDAYTDWNVKHGDLGGTPQVREAFMKQKHRMIWERRHGPVGTGMKNADGTKVEQ